MRRGSNTPPFTETAGCARPVWPHLPWQLETKQAKTSTQRLRSNCGSSSEGRKAEEMSGVRDREIDGEILSGKGNKRKQIGDNDDDVVSGGTHRRRRSGVQMDHARIVLRKKTRSQAGGKEGRKEERKGEKEKKYVVERSTREMRARNENKKRRGSLLNRIIDNLELAFRAVSDPNRVNWPAREHTNVSVRRFTQGKDTTNPGPPTDHTAEF